ncbi:MAG: glycosyl transferase family 1 [Betaproteobacteria bacterium RIFCSPLOWO2_12_FULL_63_13]|nr:MAG: glycosyl transferase family 1 [Betaproteobacteria bacterium RIFCSPLOWO2_02_FULL_63_19]OGA44364.1 MAG: glycosyl transferase family 1 [Betaproteobacteria bacterium RIFCSPLOWO2_12_FULL_63_13]
MKVLMMSNEYPPYTYGGAGVHVEYLSKELSRLMSVEVRCFGDQHLDNNGLRVRGLPVDASGWNCPESLRSVFGSIQRGLNFNAAGIDADVVHCHTWYTHLGGILAKLNYGIPLVVTTHSLEPLRPWKREQLGGGYEFSLWVERMALEMADAVIAVSYETKQDILQHFRVAEERIRIIHNGIDPSEYRNVTSTDALVRFGVDASKPYVLFVGRITRQKGIIYLVRAIEYMDDQYQVVLCAGAPDTPEIEREMQAAVAEVSFKRDNVIWIREMLDRKDIIEFYSHADVFCCPSIYEPFGIINLEAMACETPVVASAVGGIPEVVVDGETGFLVPLQRVQGPPYEPVSATKFARDLAEPINRLMADRAMRTRFGQAGRQRAEEIFSWTAIAERTKALYESVCGKRA